MKAALPLSLLALLGQGLNSVQAAAFVQERIRGEGGQVVLGADGSNPGDGSSGSSSSATGENLEADLSVGVMKSKKLHGRFLHITDIHPDPWYLKGSSVESGCHVKEKKKLLTNTGDKEKDNDGLAGYWGNAVSECDTPISLMNLTFDWIEKNIADEVDFVVWTGDNARHDIDRTIPRTPKEIYNLNHMVTDRMLNIFTKRKIGVVPSVGNNDVFPHNIMFPGPSDVIRNYLTTWKKFIPFAQQHTFERGAYYSVEVIPDQLAVISLNTLYWYDTNKAVQGCAMGSKQPGAMELDWLDVQLEMFRDRGLMVWLSGHVPPSSQNYFKDCYSRYGELMLRYQDIIVGQLYGHMNMDHFFMIDSNSLADFALSGDSKAKTKSTNSKEKKKLYDPSAPFNTTDLPDFRITKDRTKTGSLEGDLLQFFDDNIPNKESKLWEEDWSVVNVSPSVIPTYLPSLRVYSYNTTGTPYIPGEGDLEPPRPNPDDDKELEDGDEDDDEADFEVVDDNEYDDEDSSEEDMMKKKKKKKKKKPVRMVGDKYCRKLKNRLKKKCQPAVPRNHSPSSPSRTNRLFTALGYAQFYIPSLNHPKSKPPTFQLEYATYTPTALYPKNKLNEPPIPPHLLPSNITASIEDEKIVLYDMHDLTIGSYLEFGKSLTKNKKSWKEFLRFIYVSTGAEKDNFTI